MLGEHPEVNAEVQYDFGCTWYSDHGPFYSYLQIAWFVIGLPCIVATVLSLLSTCGLVCCAGGPVQQTVVGRPISSTYYGPLIDVPDEHANVDANVHSWVSRGAYGAISYGVLLAVLAVFLALHANNEADFSFLVDAFVALLMCASKIAVTRCARTVHRHLSPLSRQVAKQWVAVLALSKALTAVCAFVLFVVYLLLAILGVDGNRGDSNFNLQDLQDDEDFDMTEDEQAQLCAAGFFMVWSFLFTLISQSIAGFAFFRIYSNAVNIFGDRLIFQGIVKCWWPILVICTCGVGIALWLGTAIMVLPVLDISPLRMMGVFYFGAAFSQIFAGSAMLCCNECIRTYWGDANKRPPIAPFKVVGNTSLGTPRMVQIVVPEGATPGTILQVSTPEGGTVQSPVPKGAAPGTVFTVQY